MPVDAGTISIRAIFDDTEARAKATQYVAWMRQQMAQAGAGAPVTGAASGGFFNRMSGAGNIGGGMGGGGGFQFPSFDNESRYLKNAMMALGSAMFSQVSSIKSVAGTLAAGGGGGMGATASPNWSYYFTSLQNQIAASAPTSSPNWSVLLANAGRGGGGGGGGSGGGGGGNGSVLDRMYARFARGGGAFFAYHQINALAQQIQSGMYANRGLAYGDTDEALSSQSSAAAGRSQDGLGHLERQWEIVPKLRMLGLNSLADQYDDDKIEETLRVARLTRDSQHLTDSAREHSRLTRQSARTSLLSGHRANQASAANEIANASLAASKLRDKAKALAPYDSATAKNLFNEADDMERAAAGKAFAMRYKDKEATDTTMMGLRFGLEEQLELNKLNPGQAHAMGIYADAAMHIREMLISSDRPNAELARKIGIAQLKGFELETIMSGNGAAFDPFLQMAGPTSSKNTESVADILNKIHDEIRALSNSLQDIGQTDNPGDGN